MCYWGNIFISPWGSCFEIEKMTNVQNSVISPWAYLRGNRVYSYFKPPRLFLMFLKPFLRKFSREFNYASREKSIFRGNLISRIPIKQTFRGNLISRVSQIVRLHIFFNQKLPWIGWQTGRQKGFLSMFVESNQSKWRKLKFSREFNFANYVKSDFS